MLLLTETRSCGHLYVQATCNEMCEHIPENGTAGPKLNLPPLIRFGTGVFLIFKPFFTSTKDML